MDQDYEGFADQLMDDAEVDGMYDDPAESDESDSGFSFAGDDLPPMSRADEIVDQLLPDGFEWRRLVCSYPKAAMLVAVAGGFMVGRSHGTGLLAGLSGFVMGEVGRNVQDFMSDFAA